MTGRPDALRTLRSTHRKLQRCQDAIKGALKRPAEVRLLELQEIAQVTATLAATVNHAMEQFQPIRSDQ